MDSKRPEIMTTTFASLAYAGAVASVPGRPRSILGSRARLLLQSECAGHRVSQIVLSDGGQRQVRGLRDDEQASQVETATGRENRSDSDCRMMPLANNEMLLTGCPAAWSSPGR